MSAPTRPVLRYHGGKWRLAPWIISHFPPHRVYVEPYCGAASVFMRKPPAHAEVLNDLDGEIVNVFAVLRNADTAAQLERSIRLTPFARAEFALSYEPTDDPVERARRTIVRAFMGFGSTSRRAARTGFRARTYTQNQTGASDFARWPDQIEAYTTRLRGVLIESKPAVDLIPLHDTPQTLHYADPPYPHSTRSSMYGAAKFREAYQHEMTDDDHRALADRLHGVAGMVVLSGYPCDLYDHELYPDWERRERKALADGARERTEVVWLNPACSAALAQGTLDLGGAA